MSGSKWLIGELRRLRESAGLTQEAWGTKLHFSTSHVGAVERGERPALPDYLHAVDKVFGTTLLAFYREHIRGEWAPSWYRPFIDYENRATLLRIYQPNLVPGLLQTEDYARALLQALNVGPGELDPTLAARLDRQDLVTRAASPCRLAVVLDESSLRRCVGGGEVMRDQLKALAEAGDRTNVQIHVVPLATPAYVGLLGPLVLAAVEGRTIGYLEGHLEGRVIESPEAVTDLEVIWEAVRAYALPCAQSQELMMKVGETWT
ncbi:helix-turn-helix domain-containing protein [Solwaraspora sp. WMMB335]|uniref:helix-turn-helix domain-containing protein n=1 Tax=Solwaraspora sp. WMMB335 TaxID=3404118 RepID=UPI003B9635CB